MLGRIVLILIQVALAWRLMPEIARFLPPLGDLRIFAFALIFALLVWLVGLLGHYILKDVSQPTPSTLAVALGVALAFAALTLIPDVPQAVAKVVKIDTTLYPLIGAVIGYAIKR
ncbi:MAG: hypothetical protein ACFCUN_04390 [Hyphomicrobiaceae bacterium]